MGAPKTKNPAELAKRRARTAELYLQGLTFSQIGEQLGVTFVTAYHDMCWVREQWRTQAITDYEKQRYNELGKVDLVEVEAWKGWTRSCRLDVVQKSKSGTRPGDQGGDYQETATEKRKQAGDSRFLDVVLRCGKARRELLGLDVPVRVNVSLDHVSETLSARYARTAGGGPVTNG